MSIPSLIFKKYAMVEKASAGNIRSKLAIEIYPAYVDSSTQLRKFRVKAS